MATHASILAWRIPRTEDAGGLQSRSCKELDTTEQLSMHVRVWAESRRKVMIPVSSATTQSLHHI